MRAVLGAGLLVAVALELVPQRIDLVGFVLQSAGLGSLAALALAVVVGGDEDRFARWGTLLGSYAGLLLFLALFAGQRVG